MVSKAGTWGGFLAKGVVALCLMLVVYINIAVKRQWVDPYITGILTLMCVNIIMASSLNLINGITGQFSIGHAGFMAVGAYVSSMLSTSFRDQLHLGYIGTWQTLLPFIGLMVAGGLAAAILGFVIGLPTLRLRGDYLAIATLGFGEIIRVVILNIPRTGGPMGLTGIPKLTNFFVAEAVAVVTVVVITNIVRSSHGRAMLSVREDEIAAEAMGINTTKYKVTAFTAGAFFAGVAGALFAHHLMFINPSAFNFMKSVESLVMVVLGGLGSITGAVFAAVVLTGLPELLRSVSQYRMVAYSLLLIVLMLTRPQGLLGRGEITDFLRNRKGGRAKPVEGKAEGSTDGAR